MPSLSEFVYGLFEIANEMFIALASGATGIVVLIKHGINTNQFLRTVTVSAITAASFYYIFRHGQMTKPSRKKVVFITGCDSGLGYSLAQHAHEVGFTVIASFLNCNSPGAKLMHKKYGEKIKQIELNVTRSSSVETVVEIVGDYLDSNPKYSLWAIVNNAGVMVFGEFEWLTDHLIQHQLDVNLSGTLRVTKAFSPLLRKYRGRIITITSHCAQATLPGLAVYGATKAGLSAWSDGLRVEMSKFGVKVVTFTPGSFIQQSDIMSRQPDYVNEMHSAFTAEQHDVYDDYFMRYNSYLTSLVRPAVPRKISDDKMYAAFNRAILEKNPSFQYVNEPMRYKLYHLVFRFAPVGIRDHFVKLFMQMPEYKEPAIAMPNVFA